MREEEVQKRSSPLTVYVMLSAVILSSLGSAVTGFGMNVWVYETTKSYSLFATLAIVSALPAFLLAPIAGVIIDRFSRRTVLLVCELSGAVVLLAAVLVIVNGALSPILVGVMWVSLSAINTFVWPAVGAAVTQLTTDEQRPRVNGVIETLMGIVTVGSPLLGVAMYKLFGVLGIAIFDFSTYALCIVLIILTKFPSISAVAIVEAGSSRCAEFYRDLMAGYAWLARRRDLVRLLLFFVAINVGSSIFTVLYSPYILSFGDPRLLGVLLSIVGAGTITGGFLFSVTGGPARKENGIVVGAMLSGACMLAFGSFRDDWLLYVTSFFYGAAIPLVNASSQTVWQANVPPEMQGRVFSLRRMIAWGFNPIAILISIPLAQYLFAPLVADDGSLFARYWGSSDVGTIGLMASACGLLCASIAAFTLLLGGLRINPLGKDPVSTAS